MWMWRRSQNASGISFFVLLSYIPDSTDAVRNKPIRFFQNTSWKKGWILLHIKCGRVVLSRVGLGLACVNWSHKQLFGWLLLLILHPFIKHNNLWKWFYLVLHYEVRLLKRLTSHTIHNLDLHVPDHSTYTQWSRNKEIMYFCHFVCCWYCKMEFMELILKIPSLCIDNNNNNNNKISLSCCPTTHVEACMQTTTKHKHKHKHFS